MDFVFRLYKNGNLLNEERLPESGRERGVVNGVSYDYIVDGQWIQAEVTGINNIWLEVTLDSDYLVSVWLSVSNLQNKNALEVVGRVYNSLDKPLKCLGRAVYKNSCPSHVSFLYVFLQSTAQRVWKHVRANKLVVTTSSASPHKILLRVKLHGVYDSLTLTKFEPVTDFPTLHYYTSEKLELSWNGHSIELGLNEEANLRTGNLWDFNNSFSVVYVGSLPTHVEFVHGRGVGNENAVISFGQPYHILGSVSTAFYSSKWSTPTTAVATVNGAEARRTLFHNMGRTGETHSCVFYAGDVTDILYTPSVSKGSYVLTSFTVRTVKGNFL